jgi:hypothetical protein
MAKRLSTLAVIDGEVRATPYRPPRAAKIMPRESQNKTPILAFAAFSRPEPCQNDLGGASNSSSRSGIEIQQSAQTPPCADLPGRFADSVRRRRKRK